MLMKLTAPPGTIIFAVTYKGGRDRGIRALNDGDYRKEATAAERRAHLPADGVPTMIDASGERDEDHCDSWIGLAGIYAVPSGEVEAIYGAKALDWRAQVRREVAGMYEREKDPRESHDRPRSVVIEGVRAALGPEDIESFLRTVGGKQKLTFAGHFRAQLARAEVDYFDPMTAETIMVEVQRELALLSGNPDPAEA